MTLRVRYAAVLVLLAGLVASPVFAGSRPGPGPKTLSPFASLWQAIRILLPSVPGLGRVVAQAWTPASGGAVPTGDGVGTLDPNG